MKIFLTISAIFFTTFLFAQLPDKNSYKDTAGLTMVDSIIWKEIADGFYISDGYSSVVYRFDSSMLFRKIKYGCISHSQVDSGTWTIKNKNNLVLTSKKETLCFDAFHFHPFCFFILQAQRQSFISDVLAAELLFKNSKPIVMKDRTYSVNYRIGHFLREKYLAKDFYNF